MRLAFDWAALGLDGAGCMLRVPGLPAQHALEFDQLITVPAPTRGAAESREGVVLLLEKRP